MGGDPEAARKKARVVGGVGRLAEAFWRELDMVPLSTKRWNSRPKMNGNLKWMLDQGYTEDIIKDSFSYFRAAVPSITIAPDDSCWDCYFRRRGSYLRSAQRGREGTRPGETVHKAGDITVDNDRFRVRQVGEPVDDAVGDEE